MPGPGEVIARVEAVSICSSDIKVARMGSDHPLFRDGATADTVLGHEVSLRVHAVGADHRNRFHPGQRLGLQPAMRIGGERRIIGMDLPGGFAQYLVLGPEALADYVFEVPDSLSAAEVALLEPYGCIERAWRPNARTSFLDGGRALVVLGPGAEKFSLAERPGWTEVAVLGDGTHPAFGSDAQRITEIGAARFDDIIALGDLAASELGALFDALRPGGLLLQARKGPSPGPVPLDPARIHYEALSLLGTTETDIATALYPDRRRFDVRPGGVALVHGAGGAMGRIHVHRLLELERGPATILASSRKGKRLADLESDFGPLARARGRTLVVVEMEALLQAVAEHAPLGLDDAVVVAPEAQAIAAAAGLLAPDGLLNVFAGFPFGRRIPLDLAAVAISGMRITGSTGCSVSDMLGVMDRVLSGDLDPSTNIKAVAGLRALPSALEAVASGQVSGKVVIYPGQPEIPLTLLKQAWSRQAERTMLP
ncbi:alcohol dehydrogenase catalytic domain-containing protein [Rubellimicrobium roseum]|uniref:alcohol dehydrogenase catalytic domain-containing protein n=1 Tax=Rubellimicrobium roseum TaxID=687525 RepID=UPI00159BE2B6|nr:alcohol dehydrogenase catalytic domain-containing protein [Rubellimicrobium roseum]